MLLFFIIIRLCRQYNARNNICYITIFFIQLIIIRNGNYTHYLLRETTNTPFRTTL